MICTNFKTLNTKPTKCLKMTYIVRRIKKWIVPFEVDGFLSNFILLVPRVIGGALLAFKYAPQKFGTPWTPSSLGLSFLEVSDEFITEISMQGHPFDTTPKLFAWSICFMEAFGGILLILGLNTRMTAFFVFLTMVMAIFFRTYDGTWSVFPIFIFFCTSLFLMVFGSGKFGVDHYIAKKFNWI